MSTPTPQQVFPPPAAPAAQPSRPAGGNPLGKVNQKTWMVGGAVLVAAIGLYAGTRSAPAGDPDAAGEDGTGPYELDTTQTDVYNNLQPELESLRDAITDLSKPIPPVAVKPALPTKPAPAPKPAATGSTKRKYWTVPGDTLTKIAAKFKIRGGAPRLYAANKATIERRARMHGRKNSANGKYIYPGTLLVIP